MAAHCQPIAITHANVLFCMFNFTVVLHRNSSHQSILMLYAKKNVTKACTLLYTAVHGPPF